MMQTKEDDQADEVALQDLRAHIDNLDDQLVHLLNERAQLAQQVGGVKGSAIKFSPSREAAIMRRLIATNRGPLSDAALTAIYREIIGSCLNLEQGMRISYLGPAGTYSEEAAIARFGTMVTAIPSASIDEAFQVVEAGSADVAVVPVENSTEGSVGRTLDLLLQAPLQICDEIYMPIHHQLLSNSGTESITQVIAHPQALAQCREWLSRHVPTAALIPAASNSEAARTASATEGAAAIASLRAAKLYGLAIAAENIEDDPSNATRFLVVGKIFTKPTGADKTSLVCSVPNRAGSLQELLAVFAEQRINMVKLESRPATHGFWEYVFYIDLDGHKEDKLIARAITLLAQRATFIKVIGSYPKAVSNAR